MTPLYILAELTPLIVPNKMMEFFSTTTVALVTIPLVLYFTVTTIRNYLRLSHIKGPKGTGWSIWWLARCQLGGKLSIDLMDVGNKYGNSFIDLL